jgi:hypothetical protein
VPEKKLRIARGFALAPEAATQTFGILGQRRKGKTYAASVVAEEMVAAGIPWVALDPTGAWWGLRAGRDGRRAGGLPVYVFGGDHGDLPLGRETGAQIADLVVEHPRWYVLDLSHFESKEAERQFATAFAERFYRRKGRSKSRVHLFIDEADVFVPQRIPSGDQRMLGAFESIVRRGGIRGVGSTLISQRAAVVNKNVLEMIDVLIALRVVGPNDQRAVRSYVESHGTPEQVAELMGSLSSLELGEAWVWEPGAGVFERVRIRERRTFNSSATPSGGAEPDVALSEIDLDALRGKLDAAIAKAEAEDPERLRKRIRELEREVARTPTDAAPVVERVEIPVVAPEVDQALRMLGNGVVERLEKIGAGLSHAGAELEEVAQDVRKVAGSVLDLGLPLRTIEGPKTRQMHRGGFVAPAEATRELTRAVVVGPDDGDVRLKAGARRMLEVLARYHPMRVTRAQLGTLSKVKRTGGTFSDYFSTLKRDGLIDEAGGSVGITEAGLERVEHVAADPMTTEEIVAMYQSKLKAGARRMLDVLVDRYPGWVTRQELADEAGIVTSGGTFSDYLSTLRRNGLAEVDGSKVRAGEALYL